MTATFSQDWIQAFGLSDRKTPEFFRSLEQINSGVQLLPQAHVMRRAWENLQLDAILCIDTAPYIYFKEVSSIEPGQLRQLHRQLWNQGIAPLLVVISPREIQIFSGLALPAKKDGDVFQEGRLVDTLNRVADALDFRQFIRSVELGELFRKKPKSFNPKLRVDRYLLDKLKAARQKLLEAEPKASQKLDVRTVHALLWRTIFTCYLVDRKIIGQSHFDRIGAEDRHKLIDILEEREAGEAKQLLYDLFKQLQHDFNGDLFEGDLEIESQKIKKTHIDILKSFLRGDDLISGQLSLGFWAYDFSIIPIETISGIYEGFLEAEDAKGKRKRGVYYTPRFLAEVVLDTALNGWNSLLDKRFLDPACGSGIFLVGLFNRLAEEWRITHTTANNDECATALINILQQNLFGIDASDTACRITAFSLYLAFLDQLDPRDIQKLQDKGNALPYLLGHNILCRNFFEQSLPQEFDLIVGNPPWARVSGKQENLLEQWCQQAKVTIPQRQLAYGFILKAPYHLKENGCVCFLLPASVLFNHQDKSLEFQSKWLSTNTLEQLINLSDMRFLLFEDADWPTIIAKYRKETPNRETGYIEYVTPKTELEILRAEILVISPEDQIKIKLSEVLYDLKQRDATLTWKQCFWGTTRDRKFLSRLNTLPKLDNLTETLIQLKNNKKKRTKRWVIGQGFQPPASNDKPDSIKVVSWANEDLFVNARNKNIDLILLESDCTPVPSRFERLRRFPEEKSIFLAPHVLISQGMSKIAFCNFDVFFQDSLQGIHGPEEDSDLLMFLTAFLISDLATYYLFHTSANWGIQRDKVHEIELLRLPFPLPEEIPSPVEAKEIIKEVANLMRSVKNSIKTNFLIDRHHVITDAKDSLSAYIYQYYNIDELEQILIKDTIKYWIPSSMPNRGTWPIPTLDRSETNERKEYLRLLCNVLNTWAKRSQYTIAGNIIFSLKVGAGVIVLERATNGNQNLKNLDERHSSQDLDAAIDRIFRFLPDKQGSISFLRNLKVFDGDKLYIFKPLDSRFWTKTYALNDADEIAAAILSSSYRER